VRFAAFGGRDKPNFTQDALVKPNDPLHLMKGTSCPEPYADAPLFELWGEPQTIRWSDDKGTEHQVNLTFSRALKSAREGANPGARPYGKHAARNLGVSIMRSNRELELQTAGWVSLYDPTERWWGVEIDFSAHLDEVFGVTNNKQTARNLADLASSGLEAFSEREGFGSPEAMRDEWKQQRDGRLLLYEVVTAVESAINSMRKELKAQSAGQKPEQRHQDKSGPEATATEATQKRKIQGRRGTSDDDEVKPETLRIKDIVEGLVRLGDDQDEAEYKAKEIIDNKRKYEFHYGASDSSAFFSIDPRGGVLIVDLNTNHPAYQHLMGILEEADPADDVDKLSLKLRKANKSLKLLLAAWARLEDETSVGAARDALQDARLDWGRVAREFLR
jgi:hypothetical protein